MHQVGAVERLGRDGTTLGTTVGGAPGGARLRQAADQWWATPAREARGVTGPGNVIELDFPASSDFLALARQVVVTAARAEGGFGEERLENLQLAVSEACTNAIRAHCDAGSEAAIHIRCELGEGRIEVEVIDRGPGFDPALLPSLPAPTDPSRLYHESGLGIALMQLFTDHTEISSSPLGTAVRLVLYALPNVAPGAA